MPMNQIYAINSFNSWIGWALGDLRHLPSRDAPHTRKVIIDMVMTSLRRALTAANRMQDNARKALCLRLMNWLRADLRRAI
jgi:hypothetical protein